MPAVPGSGGLGVQSQPGYRATTKQEEKKEKEEEEGRTRWRRMVTTTMMMKMITKRGGLEKPVCISHMCNLLWLIHSLFECIMYCIL